MKISKINHHNLRNDAHFQFHTEFIDLVKKHNPETLKVKSMFDTYLTLYEREDEALKKINKSALTKKIHEADRARDEIFSGMVEVNNGMCKYFSKHIRDAAHRVKIVLGTYGNVSKKTLNEETSAIYNLVQDLRSEKYGNDTRDSSLMTWVDELEKRNKVFEALMKERFDETAHKTDIVLKKARGELDKVYHSIEERINALSIVEGVADYEEFIRTMNAVISKYAIKHNHRHSHPATTEQASRYGIGIAKQVGEGVFYI
jgi:hypothetical protein